MALVYVEFRSRRPGIPLARYHAHFGRTTGRISGEREPDDRLILNLGRSWRIGPDPEYLMVYYTPGTGLERLDQWTKLWTSDDPQIAFVKRQSMRAGRVDAAGCYEPLLEPVPGGRGPYYTEYFDLVGRAGDVASFFGQRLNRQEGMTLHLLAARIGKLGPDPPGLAVWGLRGFGDLNTIATELDTAEIPIRLVRAGIYENLGAEIL